jgi:hypothetical protein
VRGLFWARQFRGGVVFMQHHHDQHSQLVTSATVLDEALLVTLLGEWTAADTDLEIEVAEELLIAGIASAVQRVTARLQVMAAHCAQADLTGGPSERDLERVEQLSLHARWLVRFLGALLGSDESPDIVIEGGYQ